MTQLDITPRSAWAGDSRPPARALVVNDPTHVEVHHEGAGTALSGLKGLVRIRQTYDFHVGTRNWSDIFYGLIILSDGEIVEGRGVDWRSTGTALTVMVLGNYEEQEPNEAQLDAILRINDAMSFDRSSIDWHARRAAGTRFASLCPGRNMIAQLTLMQHTTNPKGIDMSKATESAITGYYNKILDRAPDASGLEYWVSQVSDKKITLDALRWEFLFVRLAAEAKATETLTANVASLRKSVQDSTPQSAVDIDVEAIIAEVRDGFLDDLIALRADES